jgi:hypothetical protein
MDPAAFVERHLGQLLARNERCDSLHLRDERLIIV